MRPTVCKRLRKHSASDRGVALQMKSSDHTVEFTGGVNSSGGFEKCRRGVCDHRQAYLRLLWSAQSTSSPGRSYHQRAARYTASSIASAAAQLSYSTVSRPRRPENFSRFWQWACRKCNTSAQRDRPIMAWLHHVACRADWNRLRIHHVCHQRAVQFSMANSHGATLIPNFRCTVSDQGLN